MSAELAVVSSDGPEETPQGKKAKAAPVSFEQEQALLLALNEQFASLDAKDRGIAVMLLERTPEKRQRLIGAVNAVAAKSDPIDGGLQRALAFIRARMAIARPTFPSATSSRRAR